MRHSIQLVAAVLALGAGTFAFGGTPSNPLASILGFNPFDPFASLSQNAATTNPSVPVALTNKKLSPWVLISPVQTQADSILEPQGQKKAKALKGNNGLGNGIDPAPPGNPRENDTAGVPGKPAIKNH